MIETERLILMPLTFGQLLKYISSDYSLEEELELNRTSRTISDELKEALEYSILPNVADDSKNYLFSTLWTIVLKSQNKMVGDLCFMGEPDAAGQITLAYEIYEDFRKQGFMTEAVGGMISWAAVQPGAKSILAETDKDNIDSSSLLLKSGFLKVGETESMFHWQLKLILEE